ncbi:MAG: hypothetical protein ABL895_03495 [Cyclobacteriaceae bacterium]
MEEFVKGDSVVVPFPFSNLSFIKRTPALVLIPLPGPDFDLCQVTSAGNLKPDKMTKTRKAIITLLEN